MFYNTFIYYSELNQLNMSITFTSVLKKQYSSHNYGIINVRITHNRISKYVPTGISLIERFWNKNGRSVEIKLRVHRDGNFKKV